MTGTDVAAAPIPHLNEITARELVDTIKRTGEILWGQVVRAYQGRAWIALGYSSWDEMCEAEFDGARIRLPREERREVVASLSDAGMSTRAIAAATGVSRPTVIKDLRTAEVANSLPPAAAAPSDDPADAEVVDAEIVDAEIVDESRHVTGIDGKAYTRPTPKLKPRRKPIDQQVGSAAAELLAFAGRIESILDDPRFSAESDELAAPLRNQLTHAIETLQRLLAQLTNGSTQS